MSSLFAQTPFVKNISVELEFCLENDLTTSQNYSLFASSLDEAMLK